MRILVIGGTRFIGPFVVRRLCGMGHAVTVFHRGKTPGDLPAEASHLLGDRHDLAAFSGVFRRLAPHVVVDMIPVTGQEARDVVRVFKGIAERLVAISSQDVYRAYGRLIGIEPGDVEPVPLDENARLRSQRFPYRGQVEPGDRLYDYDKILVEEAAMGDPECLGTVLRLPMVYGPGDYQHRLYPYLKRMDDGRPAILLDRGTAAWRSSRGYVENVAAAVVLAVVDAHSAGRIYNVSEPQAPSEAEWVGAIAAAAGWKGRIAVVPRERLPEHLAPGGNTDQPLVADTTRIREELGYREPVTRKGGLRRTVAWERAHPPEAVDPRTFDYAAEDAALGDVSSY